MGGRVEVASGPAPGASFHFALLLPEVSGSIDVGRAGPGLSDPEGDLASVLTTPRLKPGDSIRAMVVDDVAENRVVLADMLRMIGCEVVTARNGVEALQLAACEEGPGLPDIAFVDKMMPGIDGISTGRRLRMLSEQLEQANLPGRRLRLVATSASALAHERLAYLDAGFDDFLAKPIQIAGVFRCLCVLLQCGSFGQRAAVWRGQRMDGPGRWSLPSRCGGSWCRRRGGSTLPTFAAAWQK